MRAHDPEARLWLAVTALLYVLAAVRLAGYVHPDEHFQTLEWASAWLGHTPAAQLPWEYTAKIRPWLQPMLYAAVGAVFSPERPFTFALACRLVTGAIGGLGVAALFSCFRDWFPSPRTGRLAFAATATFYLAPALAVRTSSEALGAALLMLGLGLLARREATAPRDLVAGLMLGLAFDARYQLGFAVAGLLGWLVFLRAPARVTRATAGVLFGVGVGLGLDRIGYGEWVLTPWRYLSVNLLEGKAATFGEAPWWSYVGYIWHDLPLPFDALGVLALPVAMWRAPRHPLVWALAPFVLAHAAIGHKEPRFLFPYLVLAPALAALAFGPALERLGQRSQSILLTAITGLNLWWLGMDRHPDLHAGAWLEPLVASEASLRHGGRDPFGQRGLHTWIYAGPRVSHPMPLREAATSTSSFTYYLYQRRPSAPPEALEARCARLSVAPAPWAWLPSAWLIGSTGRHVFGTEHRHAVYRCPR